MSGWKVIFRDAVSGVAGVTVYDKGHGDILGRYVVAKTMKVSSGPNRIKQTDYRQAPAAVNYAKKFLRDRAKKFGVEYVPGDGVNTLAFHPVFGEFKGGGR